MFLLQILLLAQHVSGTIMPIIRSSRVLYSWLLPVVFGAWNLKTKAPNTTGSNQLYNTLELLMMGIMVPETCWASNKICNENHLLHLAGILFPHIKDNARSKPHQKWIMNMKGHERKWPLSNVRFYCTMSWEAERNHENQAKWAMCWPRHEQTSFWGITTWDKMNNAKQTNTNNKKRTEI